MSITTSVGNLATTFTEPSELAAVITALLWKAWPAFQDRDAARGTGVAGFGYTTK
jgi:hypothetical protein